MKKTCKGCYAVITAAGGHPKFGDPVGCCLKYKTDSKGHPQEDCPKPKSWRMLAKEFEREEKCI